MTNVWQATMSVLTVEWNLLNGLPTILASFSAQGGSSSQSVFIYELCHRHHENNFYRNSQIWNWTDVRRATEAWGRRWARSSISNWTSGRTAKWPGWKRWDWFWRDFTFETLKDLKINTRWSLVNPDQVGNLNAKLKYEQWVPPSYRKVDSSTPQVVCALCICICIGMRCWRSHSASDSSRAVDTCQIRSWGVYPPWEAELHLRIYGGVYIYICTFT